MAQLVKKQLVNSAAFKAIKMSSQQSWREPTSFFFQKGKKKSWVRENLGSCKGIWYLQSCCQFFSKEVGLHCCHFHFMPLWEFLLLSCRKDGIWGTFEICRHVSREQEGKKLLGNTNFIKGKKNQEILSDTSLILSDKEPAVFVDASYMYILVSWIREQFE